MKTFWGWRDQQLPDGTIIWTAPGRQTHTTHPGSRLLFPTLCKPTAPVSTPAVTAVGPNRGLTIARRKNTREQTVNEESKPNADSTTSTSQNATNHHRSNPERWGSARRPPRRTARRPPNIPGLRHFWPAASGSGPTTSWRSAAASATPRPPLAPRRWHRRSSYRG